RLALRTGDHALLAGGGWSGVPADDALHHLLRARGREAVRPDRRALADERRDAARERLARPLLAARRELELLESPPGAARGRRGDGDGDDSDDRCRDELRPGR